MPDPDDDLMAAFEALPTESDAPPVAGPKAAPTAPSPEVGSALEQAAERRRRADPSFEAPGSERRRRRELEREAAEHSPWMDELLRSVAPLSEGGRAAGSRQHERLSQMWDQMTASDARLGGRNAIEPIVGRDERAEATLLGAQDALFLGGGDELAGAVAAARGGDYRAEQQRIERRGQRAAEQAPAAYTAGAAVGSVPYVAIPGGAGLGRAGRVATAAGQAAGIGAISGALHSEHTMDVNPGDVGRDGVYTGLASGALAGGAALGLEGLGVGMDPARWRRGADAAQATADQARLEASGFWGSRAARAIDDHGGASRVADDLRRLRVGQSQGQMIPTMARATDDLSRIGREGGEQIGRIADSMDGSGVRIPTAPLRGRAEELASAIEAPGLATPRRAAGRLREEVAGLPQDYSMREALAARQSIGNQARFGGSPGADVVATEAGPQFRALYGTQRGLLQEAADSAGQGSAWSEANRAAELGHLSDDVGGGHRRLSTQGGMGGATATGDLVADAIQSGSPWQMLTAAPRAMLARRGSQEVRMVAPGVSAVVGEASAGARRSIADRLMRSAQSGGLAHLAQSPAVQQLVQAASRGGAAFATTLHVLSQRDAEVRRLMAEFDAASDEDTPEAIRAIGASEERP